MSSKPRRSGDADDVDGIALRAPTSITVSREDFAAAVAAGRTRAAVIGASVAVITAVAISALTGAIIAHVVTSTVRNDVERAAVFNCNRTNRAATVGPALKTFLATDARFNAKLGRLDTESAQIDQDLSIKLKPFPLPPSIAQDYFAQSRVFQQLAGLRAQVANLWAGQPAKHGKKAPSLARDVLTLTHVSCDQLLRP